VVDLVKLHTVFITYNRLELTKQAIASYLETVTVPYRIIVADNGSTDGTEEWLDSTGLDLNLYGENLYPGMATNLAWAGFTGNDHTHLHRADNDFVFLPGWCEEVERMFEDETIGQLGLRTGEEELWNTHNVGGNCVIPRKLWDEGLRWDETPWPKIKTPGYTEDSYFSPAVVKMGYRWTRVERPCIQPISVESPEDPYYQETWAARGITPR
jgi:glycosyltransferase involved in cell wall biosynthesis